MSVVGYLRDVKTFEDVYELVDGKNSVGRGDGNEIKISSRSVSNNHAVIEVDVSQRQFYMVVKDLGSRNATWVNEVGVTDLILTHIHILAIYNETKTGTSPRYVQRTAMGRCDPLWVRYFRLPTDQVRRRPGPASAISIAGAASNSSPRGNGLDFNPPPTPR